MYNDNMKFYHVFADGVDEFPDSALSAIECFEQYIKDGYTRIRLYMVIGREDSCIDDYEDCLMYMGDMPG